MNFDLNHALAIVGIVILGASGVVGGCDPNIVWGAMTAVAGIAGFQLGQVKKE